MTESVNEIKSKLEDLLSTLIDMEVCVTQTQNDNTKVTYSAFYGQQEASSACVLDLALANSLGAALPRIHPSAAADATKEERTPDNIKENLDEILNVCTSLVRNDHQNRIKLLDTFLGKDSGTDVPEEYKTAFDGDRLAFNVELGNYESGVMSITQAS